MQTTTITLAHDAMQFSAGHFTIFSGTEREHLHGHNFTVEASVTGAVGPDGLHLNYSVYRRCIVKLCEALHERLLLPGHSPHLAIREQDHAIEVRFNADTFVFPKDDVLVLPLVNLSLEELSRYFSESIVKSLQCDVSKILRLDVRVFSKPRQSASHTWINESAKGSRD
jgi:6-pyruvoyltetrahydropterin/6-carboxytetrahydropterin synthase